MCKGCSKKGKVCDNRRDERERKCVTEYVKSGREKKVCVREFIRSGQIRKYGLRREVTREKKSVTLRKKWKGKRKCVAEYVRGGKGRKKNASMEEVE